ncbi:hypothetical protein HK096_000967, partial [Nowakowskiella sp. JEL0078]
MEILIAVLLAFFIGTTLLVLVAFFAPSKLQFLISSKKSGTFQASQLNTENSTFTSVVVDLNKDSKIILSPKIAASLGSLDKSDFDVDDLMTLASEHGSNPAPRDQVSLVIGSGELLGNKENYSKLGVERVRSEMFSDLWG